MKENESILWLLKKVKNNKKYNTISDKIILNEIKKYLNSNPSSKVNKQSVKEIRKQLHLFYSSFQTRKKKKRYQYLEDLKNPITYKKLLSITLSTKERLLHYKKIYKNIFNIAKKPKTIMDLGCGLNPLSYLYIPSKPKYYAYDIDEEDMKFLNKFFKQENINGKAGIIDIRNSEDISQIPSTDIVFLFKVIDLIDIKNHKPSEQLIKQLKPKTKYIIASFATKTLTRKKMNHPRRKWFELMLQRLNLQFKTFQIPNEIFYVVKM